MSRILYVLCEHPEAQERLRQEVINTAAKHPDGEIPYDELVALPFLDAVCRETFRVYTPVPLLMKQYVFSPSITHRAAFDNEAASECKKISSSLYPNPTHPQTERLSRNCSCRKVLCLL